MSNELIVVKQLPIIQERLKELSTEIDKKVENAKSLICTEETVKEVKQVRADLNKDFKDLEMQRKLVKEQVLAPYMQFEEIYKQYVSDKYKNADIELKNKVDSIENELKNRKEQEIRDYFEEYKTANNIDFIAYEQARINVTLSASIKSLKEQAKQFIDKIVDDLKLIETQEHKTEILVKYKQTLNVSQAITSVTNRFKAIEEEKKRQEELKHRQMEEAQRIAEQNIKMQEEATKKALNNFVAPEVLQTPVEEKQEEILTLKFTVKGTITKLKELKQFLESGGYDYE
jgi:hypothetical protein